MGRRRQTSAIVFGYWHLSGWSDTSMYFCKYYVLARTKLACTYYLYYIHVLTVDTVLYLVVLYIVVI